ADMMEIDTDEDTLRQLAAGGSMNFSAWPLLLCDIINRLEKIAHNEFPIPVIPPPPRLTPPPEPRFLAPLPSSDPIGPSELKRVEQSKVPTTTTSKTTATTTADVFSSPGSSQENNKENANPSSNEAQAVADAPADTTTTISTSAEPVASSSSRVTDSQAQQPAPGELPIQIQQQLTEITSTLTTGFPDHPPHTIQRLAELVLHPRQHYRSLPSYLHAVDRVVHVASGANIFPLSPAVMDPRAMAALANGVPGGAPANPSSSPSTSTSSTVTAQPGLDEHLGGALLTPIPWLTNRPESVDGADAALSPEPDMDDEDGEPADTLHSQHHPQPQQQHSGSGRQRHQQRLSTESTETIEGPNGVGHIETVSVSVNGIVSHGASTSALAAALGRGGTEASSSSALSTSQAQQPGAGGITQGELLREEQRAGVVPVSQVQRGREAAQSRAAASAAAPAAAEPSGSPVGSTPTEQGDEEMDDALGEADEAAGAGGTESEEETPHVRGPEEIGLADTGPQAAGTSIPAAGQTAPNLALQDINVEAAMGRPADETRAASAPTSLTSSEPSGVALDSGDDAPRDRASTPKRDADGEPASRDEPPAKKLRESPQEAVKDSQDGEKPAQDGAQGAEPDSKE
ncbi:hypothetical protein PpBr36_00255, partial [Pyricularia pennisetigena]|uniref:hypothetical protein n=1 Tax=Pyricularia pennisetigena TaxID=1578925 RepID=UPI00115306B7